MISEFREYHTVRHQLGRSSSIDCLRVVRILQKFLKVGVFAESTLLPQIAFVPICALKSWRHGSTSRLAPQENTVHFSLSMLPDQAVGSHRHKNSRELPAEPHFWKWEPLSRNHAVTRQLDCLGDASILEAHERIHSRVDADSGRRPSSV